MRLDAIYGDYLLINNLLDYVTKRAGEGSADFLLHIRFPDVDSLDRTPKRRRQQVASRVREISERHADAALLAMAAEFERMVFGKLPDAIAAAATTLQDRYPPDAPLHAYRAGFTRSLDDFQNLGGLRILLESGALAQTDRGQLDRLVKERNFIAHGRRPDWRDAQSFSAIPDVNGAYELFKKIAETL